MNLLTFSWLQLSVAVPLIGAVCIGFVRAALPAYRLCIWFAGATLACASMACVGHFTGQAPSTGLVGVRMLSLDDLSAPLLPLVALLHLLTAVATARTKMGRFSFAGLLAAASVRLAIFACMAPWPLIALLALDAALPYFEIRRRDRPSRLYAIHAALFVLLLVVGWIVVTGVGWIGMGSLLLLAAVLLRTGAIPAQVWVSDLFENGTFGTALLFATPLAGAYAAMRLFLPIAPQWALEVLLYTALGTAVYAAGIGVVERDSRRYFAYLFQSHASLVLVGIGLHTPFALTGALVLWISSALALTGLGLTLRAIEARVGSPTLADYGGLYEHSPALAVFFLLTGLAAGGFPGTSGFVAAELLVDEAVGEHLAVGMVVVFAAAINGIGVLRAYFLIFTGRAHETGVALGITPRERVAVLTLAALILGGGLAPQAYLESRQRAAAAVLHVRNENLNQTPEARIEKHE